ncbi:hypothetical protein BMF94_4606 [Rhodotorula taiwanensis]|uniref:Tyrosine specific protein phosphatases domain-containing protein n=1 Tax=Rhodotorula taiwanensis TaxID=741276 RepID=A0A2S5B693_9BASI|nr:hypothetical protein BMF94_4606 [Rhodotorula taiwanensis]
MRRGAVAGAQAGLTEGISTPRSRPVSPPFKRSLSAGPQTDDRSRDKAPDATRQAVRVKLWDQEARPLSPITSTRLTALASAAADPQDSSGGISIPGTPPELPYAGGADPALLAEAVETALAGGSCESPDALGLVADRQLLAFDALEPALATLLSRLCSQHWLSDYNSLKRSIASGAIQAPFVPISTVNANQQQSEPGRAEAPRETCVPPTPEPISQIHGTSKSHPSDLIFLRPSGEKSPSATNSPARDGISTSTGLTPRAAKVSLAHPVLTTSATSFEALVPRAGIAAAEQVLADLDQGEPVSIGATTANTSALTGSAASSPRVIQEVLVAPSAAPPPPPPGMFLANGMAVKTSLSHPINISPLIPPDTVAVLADRIFDRNASFLPTERRRWPSSHPSFVLSATSGTDLYSLVTEVPPMNATMPAVPRLSGNATSSLGNFVLSSCPGKKVRMNGEAAKCGRGAICRDVLLDLQRARDEHNVRLVVCCLDDAELHFLGVPWSDYAIAADKLGLEVVRMPMLEGFAPASAEQLDADLAHIVRDYTLRGFSVLAHCRGGIGRAGLVASCWMLKMGLVAIPPASLSDSTPVSAGLARDISSDNLADPPAETLEVLVRVIELIRRRRNIKAIETPHQVHFLLQYITHLRDTARIISASDLLAHTADV